MATKRTRKPKQQAPEPAPEPQAADQAQPLTLIELQAENVKRLKAARLRLDGRSLVVVGGQNAQGKTSLLDSVEMLLRGASAFPAEPVTRGKRQARIVADFGDLVVFRKIQAGGGHALEVRAADGSTLKRPQELLDSLCSRIAFDPLQFATMAPAKQDETLKALVGLDFQKLDAQEAVAREERKQLNRDQKQAQAMVEGLDHFPDAPRQEVSVAQLTESLEEAEAELADQADARQALEAYDQETANMVEAGKALDRRILTLKTQIADLEAEQGGIASQVTARQAERQELAQAVESMVPPDTSAIRAQLRNADEINRKIRANQDRKLAQDRADQLRRQAEELTEQIEAIQAERAAILESASFPVDGLGFDASGVTFQGLPLEQASQAERLRVSVAIGFALNPRIRVLLVRDGSLLDDRHLALLGELAAEHGGQLLVERVGDRDAGAVVIEDGEVRD